MKKGIKKEQKIRLNSIYNEDCLITMSKMEDNFIDLILTDPPYGVGIVYDSFDDTEKVWESLMHKVLPEMIRVSKMLIFPCCRIAKLDWFYTKKVKPDWIMCWYKGSVGSRSFIGFNDWEPHLVYGKIKGVSIHDHFQTKASPTKGTYQHPCPKPDDWAKWIIKRVGKKQKLKIYDPFTGSGTVPFIAKKYGHDYIGSEISESYCKIINKRLGKNIDKWDKEGTLF